HDGRQRLPRRPRRRPDADAVDGRSKRRLLAGRLRAPLPAAADGSGLGLPGHERRGGAADPDVVPALAAPLHRAAKAAPGVRPRDLSGARAREPADLRSRQDLGGRRRALRPQRRALGLAVVQCRSLPGTHEIYQLPFGRRREGDWQDDRVIAEVDGWTVYDAMDDPVLARELFRLIGSGETLGSGDATLEFRTVNGA